MKHQLFTSTLQSNLADLQNRELNPNLKITDVTLGLPPENYQFQNFCSSDYDNRSYGNSPHASPFASNAGSALSSPIHQSNLYQIQGLNLSNSPNLGGIFGGSGQNSPVFGQFAGYSGGQNQPNSISSITQGKKNVLLHFRNKKNCQAVASKESYHINFYFF